MKRKMCMGVGVQASRHEVAAVPMADPGLQGMSDEAITVEQFCRRYVEPMGEESDHVHIVALTDALQVCPKRNAFPAKFCQKLSAAAASSSAATACRHATVSDASVKCELLVRFQQTVASMRYAPAGAHPGGVPGPHGDAG